MVRFENMKSVLKSFNIENMNTISFDKDLKLVIDQSDYFKGIKITETDTNKTKMFRKISELKEYLYLRYMDCM